MNVVLFLIHNNYILALEFMNLGLYAFLVVMSVHKKFHVQNMLYALVVVLSFIGFSLIPVNRVVSEKC
uniref:Uncharacterized protein n=1 Tax=Arundo donax TaxID=35708 RepID=A0A0A9HDF0_ARUDO